MTRDHARGALLAAMLAVAPMAGRAGELADFNAAVEAAAAHNRVAIGYLRAGNLDLAAVELERLRAAWAKVSDRFAGRRPDAFAGNALYVTVFTDIATRLVTADLMLDSGRADAAREALAAIREDLYNLRRSAGILVLADCVRDANRAMDALMAYDTPAIDWTRAETRFDIVGKAAVYGHVLERCDAMADGPTRENPEFRRLIDGAKASLALIPQAIAARDAARLHRILIELRSFDNLLAFRYG